MIRKMQIKTQGIIFHLSDWRKLKHMMHSVDQATTWRQALPYIAGGMQTCTTILKGNLAMP